MDGSEIRHAILLALLRLGAVPWAPGVPDADVCAKCATVAESEVRTYLEQLRAGGSVEVGYGQWRLTRAGYAAVEQVVRSKVEDPIAGLTPAWSPPRGFPLLLENPHGTPWDCEARFIDDVRTACRDSGLARELQKRLERVLADPEAGKEMRGARSGTIEARVRSFRLHWSFRDGEVKFLLFAHKEDRRNAPFGS